MGDSMIGVVRRLGIALGSVVIAWLALGLLAGLAFGPSASQSLLFGIAVLALGGLIYRDIIRRERRA